MPDETGQRFNNWLNDIYALMVNDTGEAMKKTQVIKVIRNEFSCVCSDRSKKSYIVG